MKRRIHFFIFFMMLSSINLHAGLVDIEGETTEEICRSTLPKECRDAVDDEDELRLVLAQNLSILKKHELKSREGIFLYNNIADLLQKFSDPPLRYDFDLYEKKWDEYSMGKNIKDLQGSKNQFFRKLELEEKKSYLRNVFNKFDWRTRACFDNISNNQSIFDMCVQTHIARRDDPEKCDLRNVAYYEKDIQTFGWDNIYKFIMQRAILCQRELEACNRSIDALDHSRGICK